MNILYRLFDYIYDLPKYKRMLGFFLFTGVTAAILYIIFGMMMVPFGFPIMNVFSGALGCLIGCGAGNAIAMELTRKG